MQYNLGLVSRGLQPPHHFLEENNFFLHKIGVDEREETDKKRYRKEEMQPKSDIPYANSSMFFLL